MEPSSTKLDPKKILIILHGSIGDVSRALPLARMVREGFPRAWIAWSVEPLVLPLLQGNASIDEIIVFDRPGGWRAFISFLAQVRRRKFDLVLDLQRHLKSGLISWMSGAAQRIGFHRSDAKEFNWIFNNLHIEPFGEAISKLEHYLKFADYLGIPRQRVQWDFAFTSAERASVDRHLSGVHRPFATFFVGTRWESKQWFPLQMARCAELLADEFGLDVVLLGDKQDQTRAQSAIAETRVSITDLVGRTSLREAIGVIQRARLAIGPDTGLMHVAAAVGTPVISLWGATSPQRTGPYGFDHLIIQGKAPCVPCNRRRCSIGRICMKSITNAEISEKVAGVTNRASARQARHVEGV